MTIGSETIFLWGFLGSAAVDVMTLAKFYDAPIIEFPERYRRISYYVVRLVVALIAGGLAVAYGIEKEILAINIGAATPLIIQAFSQGLPSHGSQPGLPTAVPRSKKSPTQLKGTTQEISNGKS